MQADDPAAKKQFLEKSLEAFRQALALAPQDDRFMLLAAEALDTLGRLDESSHLFDRLLQLDPKSGPVILAYGWHLHAQGRFTEAAAQFRRAVQLGAGPSAQAGLERATEELKRSWKTAPPAPVKP
jgi:Tfp pilus assembly protein PilF